MFSGRRLGGESDSFCQGRAIILALPFSSQGNAITSLVEQKTPRLLMAAIYITPAIKYPKSVIPAKAGIQKSTGCRIKSGMTKLAYLIAGLI